ncbi:MAG: hypothetical protein MI861_16250, partial [Pirellulales bacterium]|nr:hypothetical protein [Pirellulales bacterium]
AGAFAAWQSPWKWVVVFSVVVSDRADGDIFRNANWWAKHRSPDQAERWYNDPIRSRPWCHGG